MTSAFANPVLGNVSAGNVSIQQTTNSTVVNQTSNKAIINWQSFNIGQSQSTHFQQPTGGIALNRINPSNGPSSIYGRLTATGQIILINSAGLFFGSSAYVNVGSLIASTANLADKNFLKGKYNFVQVPAYLSSSITNQGQLIAANHGLIALLGSNVQNNGLIQANLGHVVLAAGGAFTMTFAGEEMVSFKVNKKTLGAGGIVNTGTLRANGGQILVTANAAQNVLDNVIDMRGVAEAKSVTLKNGQVVLGSIAIIGGAKGGVVKVAATINASGKKSGQTGGNVNITGYDVLLNSPTLIDVSGEVGGGNINIGGDEHGAGSLSNANATVMMPNVSLLANAITQGNGGNIVLWSNAYTAAYGSISAKRRCRRREWRHSRNIQW